MFDICRIEMAAPPVAELFRSLEVTVTDKKALARFICLFWLDERILTSKKVRSTSLRKTQARRSFGDFKFPAGSTTTQSSPQNQQRTNLHLILRDGNPLAFQLMGPPNNANKRLRQLQDTLKSPDIPEPTEMNWPKLPARAAYLTLNNARRRNALSLAVLRDLRDQLHSFNRSPKDGKVRMLPPFKPEILEKLESAHSSKDPESVSDYGWLLDSSLWHEHREGLPNVLVLRSDGPVFSAGHDLGEVRQLSHDEVKETFALCAEVMSLIRRSPAPVIGCIQGLATAAGAQLALTTDLPIACASTQFRLPGASLGLPCTSPSTAVARKLGNSFTYRMLALAEPVRADQLPGGAVETVEDSAALEARVAAMVEQLADKTAGQPQALGKWAFHTQVGITGGEGGGDGYEDAVSWTGRVMALHARSSDAVEGMNSFFEKRSPSWKT